MLNDQENDPISKILNDSEAVSESIRMAVKAAILRHKQMDNPICVSRNGSIVWLAPNEI